MGINKNYVTGSDLDIKVLGIVFNAGFKTYF